MSRRRWFEPAEEQPFQRRTSDRIRVAAAVIVLMVLAAHTGDLTPTERAIFQFFNTLPSGLQSFFQTLYRFGGLWAVGMVGAAALPAGRWRLARDLILSGTLAWGLARIVGLIAVEHQSLRKSLDVVTRLGHHTELPVAAARGRRRGHRRRVPVSDPAVLSVQQSTRARAGGRRHVSRRRVSDGPA